MFRQSATRWELLAFTLRGFRVAGYPIVYEYPDARAYAGGLMHEGSGSW